MNSAIQCLVNLKPIHEYFAKDETYKSEVNTESVLGFKGILVSYFADLVKELWRADSVVEPNEFKATLSKLNEQFAGYD